MVTFAGERTFNLTEFGIQALDRNLPQGIQRDIMEQLFESGPMTSSDLITEYSRLDPNQLKRLVDDLISRNWVQTIEAQ